MKVQAIKNAPDRAWQDMADISFLVGLPGVDRHEVRAYFENAGLLTKWEAIERGR